MQAEIKKLKKGKDTPKTGKSKGRGKAKNDGNTKPKWFTKRPQKDDLHKSKEWKGKQWYYCHPDTGGKCEGVWRQHKPSQCKGKGYRFNKNLDNKTNPKRKDENESNTQSKKKRTMKLERALQASQAVAEPDEDESNSSESDE